MPYDYSYVQFLGTICLTLANNKAETGLLAIRNGIFREKNSCFW